MKFPVGHMKKTIRLSALITFTLLLPMSFSGCIDIHWADDLLYEEPVVVTFSEHTKWTLEYYFDAGPHQDERPVHINKNTLWMNKHHLYSKKMICSLFFKAIH